MALARCDIVRVLVEATKEARLDVMIGGYTHTLEMSIMPHHALTTPPRFAEAAEAADGSPEVQSRWLEKFSQLYLLQLGGFSNILALFLAWNSDPGGYILSSPPSSLSLSLSFLLSSQNCSFYTHAYKSSKHHNATVNCIIEHFCPCQWLCSPSCSQSICPRQRLCSPSCSQSPCPCPDRR